MKTAQKLKCEYAQTPSGSFARDYFKYLGFRRDLTAPPATANANAIEALFTLPEPYIYKNDLIVGSIRPLWSEVDRTELDYANRIVVSFGVRRISAQRRPLRAELAQNDKARYNGAGRRNRQVLREPHRARPARVSVGDEAGPCSHSGQ